MKLLFASPHVEFLLCQMILFGLPETCKNVAKRFFKPQNNIRTLSASEQIDQLVNEKPEFQIKILKWYPITFHEKYVESKFKQYQMMAGWLSNERPHKRFVDIFNINTNECVVRESDTG